VRELVGLGVGAEVVSGGELLLALECGATTIIMNGVGKTKSDMDIALRALTGGGAKKRKASGSLALRVVAESQEELRAWQAAADAHGVDNLLVGLRLNPDISSSLSATHKHLATGHDASKFGFSEAEAVAVFADRARYPRLRIAGIHAHVGSQICDLATLRAVSTFLCSFYQRVGGSDVVDFVDVGGGLGVQYMPDAPAPPTPDEYARTMRAGLESIMAGPKAPSLLVELGRSLVASCGIMVTEVLARKSNGPAHFTVVDAGFTDFARPALYDAAHGVVNVSHPPPNTPSAQDIPGQIVGCICESTDILAKQRNMSSFSAGDRVAFLHAGAYGHSMASRYNGRCLPSEVVLEEGGRYKQVFQDASLEELVAARVAAADAAKWATA
jgi:diaminopimelate decarboxylase